MAYFLFKMYWNSAHAKLLFSEHSLHDITFVYRVCMFALSGTLINESLRYTSMTLYSAQFAFLRYQKERNVSEKVKLKWLCKNGYGTQHESPRRTRNLYLEPSA